jgi:hypothetical protein
VNTGELSLVPNGANDKRFAMRKENLMKFNETMKSVLETEAEGEADLIAAMEKAGVSEDDQAAAVAQYRMANGFSDVVSKETFALIAKAAGLEVEKAEHPDDDDDEEGKPKKPKKPFPGAAAQFGKEAEVIRKEFEEKLAKSDERNEKLQKEVADIKRTTLRKELVVECEKDFAHVPGKSFEEMADMLLKAREVGEDFEKDLREQWKATAETVRKSALFETAGVTQRGGGAGSAEVQLDKLAKEHQKDSSEKITFAKAYDEVIQDHPELYKQYLNEHPAQTQR